MKYSDLNLEINTNTIIADVNGKEVEVLQYLPMQDKIDLIEVALQKSLENGIYNEMKLDMYFNLYIVYMYTNLEFTDEEREDEYKLYDELQSNDVITSIIGCMEEGEYDCLLDYLKTMQEAHEMYRGSAASLLQTFVEDMPKNAEAAKNIVDNFDPEKYKAVVDFVKAANNGRIS